ncbi:MAG: TetR/AcrR family transcriptional regulator [Propioniciclava sp.]|uniref:TetR/AcrR family transcriptional regulator n=1 Tax=Propioniciclava sp. TaxID=2038686 RepID=UPI0039E39FC6
MSKRDEIVAAATRLIRDEGVHAASISEIIAESHTSAGTIYHHFANKGDIVLAVARAGLVDPLQSALLAQGRSVLGPPDIFRAIVTTVRSGAVESALIVQLWAGSSTEPALRTILHSQFQAARQAMYAHIEAWLVDRGAVDAAARVDSVARVTLGQAMGFLAQSTLDPDFDSDAYVAEATALLDGIA